MEEELFNKLQKLGLNLYESKAYAALLKTGTSNAYKVSKESGIPRARIYDVLETLTERGLAMVEESSENAKIYTPVPSKVFLKKTKKEWENDFEEVTNALNQLETEAGKQEVYVFTVKGKENIISYCRQMLRDASQYVMVSMWNEMYGMLLPGLEECQHNGCKILGICHNIQNPVDGIETHISGKYHNMAENLHWFIISADGRKLLYGYSAETDRDAFYTEDVSHIYLLEDYIMHDMVVNRFISENKNEKKMSSMMEDILTKMGRNQENW